MKRRLLHTVLIGVSTTLLFVIYLFSREPDNLEDVMGDSEHYIKLSEGYTQYRDVGSRDGEVVLLMHGFSVAMFCWEPVERQLVQSGLRVVSYSQYGRGYSSRGKLSYDRAMYLRQLDELLDSLSITTAHFVGQSVGASLVSLYAVENQDRVKSVTLIAPLLDKVTGNRGITFCRTSIAGSALTNLIIADAIYKRSDRIVASVDNVPREEWLENMKKQARIKGFRYSVITLLQGDVFEDYSEVYEELGKSGIPVLMVTGGADNSIPPEHFDTIYQKISHMTRVEFKDNNHGVALQQVDSVSSLIETFIFENSVGEKDTTVQ